MHPDLMKGALTTELPRQPQRSESNISYKGNIDGLTFAPRPVGSLGASDFFPAFVLYLEGISELTSLKMNIYKFRLKKKKDQTISRMESRKFSCHLLIFFFLVSHSGGKRNWIINESPISFGCFADFKNNYKYSTVIPTGYLASYTL